jgi:hypothetical protein
MASGVSSVSRKPFDDETKRIFHIPFQKLLDAIEDRLKRAETLVNDPTETQQIHTELDQLDNFLIKIIDIDILDALNKQHAENIRQTLQKLKIKKKFTADDLKQLSQLIQQAKSIIGSPTITPPVQEPAKPSVQQPMESYVQEPEKIPSEKIPSEKIPVEPSVQQPIESYVQEPKKIPSEKILPEKILVEPSVQPGKISPEKIPSEKIPSPTYDEIQRDTIQINTIVNDLSDIMNKIITNATITQSDKQNIANFAQKLQDINQKYPSADPKNDVSKTLTDVINSLRSMTGGTYTYNIIQRGGVGNLQLMSIIKSLIDISNILLTRMNKLIIIFSPKKASQHTPSVPPTDTTDYTKPLLALITYKIGSFNVFDIELIKYCESIGFDINTTLAIHIANNKNDIDQILYHYNKNFYFSPLMNILRLKKLSAEMKFRKDYGVA